MENNNGKDQFEPRREKIYEKLEISQSLRYQSLQDLQLLEAVDRLDYLREKMKEKLQRVHFL